MMQLKWMVVCCLAVSVCWAFPEQGRWTFDVDQTMKVAGVIKAVYEGTGVYIKVTCNSEIQTYVNISYVIRATRCYQERLDLDNQEFLERLHNEPSLSFTNLPEDQDNVMYFKSKIYTHLCDRSIIIEPDPSQTFLTPLPSHITSVSPGLPANATLANSVDTPTQTNGSAAVRKRAAEGETVVKSDDVKVDTTVAKTEPTVEATTTQVTQVNTIPQFTITQEGLFIVTIKVEAKGPNDNFTATVDLDIKGSSGYLSVLDWPLLPFYGSMCVIYFFYGLVWLIVLALQWRDLLRIQFWIGAVIFLGMVEKAVFYAEYQSINSTGTSVRGAVLFAELVSCMKRTLARMLVIIVSLGFGIVKPRLGPMLHRVVGVGGLFLLLCSVEAFLRVMRDKNESARTLMLAEVPLAVLDTAICWWIFRNLVQTTRTLRLRRNLIKLSLYRHFTNTLIFACIASVAFMVWVYKAHNLPKCVTDWKELWVDDAYWHLLFSVVLLVIMILWRPTNNNQRYAFTPLIDAGDDEEDDTMMNGAYDGMKIRLKQQNSGSPTEKEPLRNKMDEDLAWVEENIPSSADTALPRLIDSDEEIMTTKFEMSKME